MKAAFFKEHGGSDKILYDDYRDPVADAGEVVVRVKACALNHVDMLLLDGRFPPPEGLPHVNGCEVTGTVETLGAGVRGVATGQRVIVFPGFSCGTCEFCLRGELIFTSLYRKAMPLIRYRTRDVVQVADRRCPCGRTLLALEGGVLARLDDMKKVRGIIVYPRRVEELVRPFAGVDEFQILFRRHEGLDDIVVRIDPSPALSRAECDGLCGQLADALRIGLGIRVTVEATAPGALPRWDHKARRVKDERTEVPF